MNRNPEFKILTFKSNLWSMRLQQKFERTFKSEKSLKSRFFLHIIIKNLALKNRLLIQHTLKSIYNFFQDERMNRVISKSF